MKTKKKKSQHVRGDLPALPGRPFFARNKKFIAMTLCAFLIVFVGCFGLIAFGSHQFFHRDCGFFYYPLFQQIQRQWESGQLPLWDRYENLGQPLLANPTSSVFYPGKIVFFFSSVGLFSYDVCFKWYILLHFPLAFYFFYRLARHIGISRVGGMLGAIAWTFSGTVVFASSNPVFLIGACWLTCGLLFADKTLRTGNPRYAVAWAASLAMMILGGDPQAAWLCSVLAAGLAVVVFRRKNISRKIMFLHGGLLLAGIVVGGAASAVQVLPALDMNRSIDRGNSDAPLNVWELLIDRVSSAKSIGPSSVLPAIPDAVEPEQKIAGCWDNILCRRLEEPGHASSIYRFSMPPWRLCELVFPNVGGDWVSGRGRWFSILPHDDQLWNASLYMGIIPFLLAVWAVFPGSKARVARSKRSPDLDRAGKATVNTSAAERTGGYRIWAIWLVFLATFAALGAFGPVWMIRSIAHGWDNNIHNGDPVGGLYWFMVVLLPLFATFRYPAKLSVLVTLALALLAGIGIDRLRSLRNGTRLAMFAFVPSFALCLLFGGFGPALLESVNGRTFVGSMPLDALAVSHGLTWAFGHTAIVSFFFWLTLVLAEKHRTIRQVSVVILLVLTSLDLAWAHRLLVPSIPEEAYRSERLVAQTIQEDCDHHDDREPVRIWRGLQWNPLLVTNEPDRLQRAFTMDRKTLAPKYSYADHLGIANVHGTGVEFSYRRFLERLERLSCDSAQREHAIDLLARFNVRYLVLPWQNQQGEPVVFPNTTLLDQHTSKQYSFRNEFEQAMEHLDDPWPVNTLVWRNDIPGSILRISPTFATTSAGRTGNRSGQDPERSSSNAEPAVSLISYTSCRIEFEAVCPVACDVVVAEQFWNGWHTKAVSKDEPDNVLNIATVRDEVTGVLRQVSLPAGTWRVAMEYRPDSVYRGLVISCGVWLVLGGLWLFFSRRSFARWRHRIRPRPE